MRKGSRKRSSSRVPKRSSPSRKEQDPLKRIHAVRRRMEAERQRLGLSFKEYFEYLEKKNEKIIAEFGLKRQV